MRLGLVASLLGVLVIIGAQEAYPSEQAPWLRALDGKEKAKRECMEMVIGGGILGCDNFLMYLSNKQLFRVLDDPNSKGFWLEADVNACAVKFQNWQSELISGNGRAGPDPDRSKECQRAFKKFASTGQGGAGNKGK